VTEDIRALTARLAEEPGSLAFLELAEALRRRGQLEPAYKVARGGLTRYPSLADAHDLMARVLSDQGDLAGAFEAWTSALQLDPMRTSALKGIAFLYYRAGDAGAAVAHLERALEVEPDDASIRQALVRLGPEARRAHRDAPGTGEAAAAAPPDGPADWGRDPGRGTSRREDTAAAAAAPPPAGPAGPFGAVGAEAGLLLVDTGGMRLGGRLEGDETAAGDRVAAQLAGVSREAARATRLLGLGTWEVIAVESPDGHLALAPATADTVVLAARPTTLPVGRVMLLAERAARAAAEWLERQT
jgi:tetratricopeptide (TPR) repeat protein